ncbi:unnamed protein product, partial [Didymodactylos carnosus]
MSRTNHTNGDTSSNKLRRKEPPFLVYLRFRPFILDEIAKGENQKTIEILDEKRVGIKIYPSNISQIRSVQSSYNEYEVTRVFNEQCTQEEFYSQTFEMPTNAVFEGSNWLLFTMGLSNSGKTHTMFGSQDKPGVIPQCLTQIFHYIGSNIDNSVLYKPTGFETYSPCKPGDLNQEISYRNYIFKQDRTDERITKLPRIVQNQCLDDLSLQDEYYSVWISFFELYNEQIYDLLVKPNEIKTRKPLRLLQGDSTTTIRNLIQVPVFDLNEAKDVVKFAFINRSTSKTVFNEASSRSHAILCITLITTDEFSEVPTMSHLYICDLAGNEPLTQHVGKQMNETCNINTSLMTLKDCIRILNENQKTKKQFVVPFRNSVLTNLFRPFFTGIGQISIVVNINPCASFTSQTNDLLKFASLAQKTTIVQCEPVFAKQAASSSSTASKHLKLRNLKRLRSAKVIPVQRDKRDKPIDEEEHPNDEYDEHSIVYWRKATDAALKLLQKQATWRRSFMLERHEERVKLLGCLMQQRDVIRTLKTDLPLLNDQRFSKQKNVPQSSVTSIHLLTEKNDDYSKKVDQLQRSYDERMKQFDLMEHNYELLKHQHEQMKNEYESKIIDYAANKSKLNSQITQLNSEHSQELARLKRDLNLEVYRKQEFEKRFHGVKEKLETEIAESVKQKKTYERKQYDHQQTIVKYDNLQIELCRVREQAKELTDQYDEQKKSYGKISLEKDMWKNKYEATVKELEEAKSSTQQQDDDSIITRRRLKRQTHNLNDEDGNTAKKVKRVTRSSSKNISSSDDNDSIVFQTKTSKKKTSTRQKKNSETKSSSRLDEIDRGSKMVKQIQKQIRPKSNKKKVVVRSRQEIDSHRQTPTTTTRTVSLSTHRANNFSPLNSNSPPMLTDLRRTPSIVSKSHAIPVDEQSISTPKSTMLKKRLQSLFHHTPPSENSVHFSRVQMKTSVAFGSSISATRMLQPIITPQMLMPPPPKAQTPKIKYNLRTRLNTNPSYQEDEMSINSKTSVDILSYLGRVIKLESSSNNDDIKSSLKLMIYRFDTSDERFCLEDTLYPTLTNIKCDTTCSVLSSYIEENSLLILIKLVHTITKNIILTLFRLNQRPWNCKLTYLIETPVSIINFFLLSQSLTIFTTIFDGYLYLIECPITNYIYCHSYDNSYWIMGTVENTMTVYHGTTTCDKTRLIIFETNLFFPKLFDIKTNFQTLSILKHQLQLCTKSIVGDILISTIDCHLLFCKNGIIIYDLHLDTIAHSIYQYDSIRNGLLFIMMEHNHPYTVQIIQFQNSYEQTSLEYVSSTNIQAKYILIDDFIQLNYSQLLFLEDKSLNSFLIKDYYRTNIDHMLTSLDSSLNERGIDATDSPSKHSLTLIHEMLKYKIINAEYIVNDGYNRLRVLQSLLDQIIDQHHISDLTTLTTADNTHHHTVKNWSYKDDKPHIKLLNKMFWFSYRSKLFIGLTIENKSSVCLDPVYFFAIDNQQNNVRIMQLIMILNDHQKQKYSFPLLQTDKLPYRLKSNECATLILTTNVNTIDLENDFELTLFLLADIRIYQVGILKTTLDQFIGNEYLLQLNELETDFFLASHSYCSKCISYICTQSRLSISLQSTSKSETIKQMIQILKLMDFKDILETIYVRIGQCTLLENIIIQIIDDETLIIEFYASSPNELMLIVKHILSNIQFDTFSINNVVENEDEQRTRLTNIEQELKNELQAYINVLEQSPKLYKKNLNGGVIAATAEQHRLITLDDLNKLNIKRDATDIALFYLKD